MRPAPSFSLNKPPPARAQDVFRVGHVAWCECGKPAARGAGWDFPSGVDFPSLRLHAPVLRQHDLAGSAASIGVCCIANMLRAGFDQEKKGASSLYQTVSFQDQSLRPIRFVGTVVPGPEHLPLSSWARIFPSQASRQTKKLAR
eukprot:2677663-Rhodomonas_salina.1